MRTNQRRGWGLVSIAALVLSLAGGFPVQAASRPDAPRVEPQRRSGPRPPTSPGETEQTTATWKFTGRRSLRDVAERSFRNPSPATPAISPDRAKLVVARDFFRRRRIHPPKRLGPDGQPTPPAATSRRGSALQSPAVPTAPAHPVAGPSAPAPGFAGFKALDAVDTSIANGIGGEPPDLALCVGNGRVVEAINSQLTVYAADSSGVALLPDTSPLPEGTPAVSFNELFGYEKELSGPPDWIVEGPDLFDPSCHFDQDVGRFFLVVAGLFPPIVNDEYSRSKLGLAVSATADPLGDWATFELDTTQSDRFDRTCPCVDDFPHLATDANGVFISANRFVLDADVVGGSGFEGAKLHALSKPALAREAAAPRPADVGAVTVSVGVAGGVEGFNVLPALTPPGEDFPRDRQYFVSSTDAEAGSDHRAVVWALSGTESLGHSRPRLTLSHKVLDVLPYVDPSLFPTAQKPGPFPLGASLGEPLGELEPGSDHPLEVPYYVDGLLWVTWGTAIRAPGRPPHAGVVWMLLEPSFQGGRVGARLVQQDYLVVESDSVMFPAFGITQEGRGAMVFSVAGPRRHPSLGYVLFDRSGPIGPVRIGAAGETPNDSFTCYTFEVFDPQPCRWGDYSAARVGAEGELWLATEYNVRGLRTRFSNWETFVGRLELPQTEP